MISSNVSSNLVSYLATNKQLNWYYLISKSYERGRGELLLLEMTLPNLVGLNTG